MIGIAPYGVVSPRGRINGSSRSSQKHVLEACDTLMSGEAPRAAPVPELGRPYPVDGTYIHFIPSQLDV
jgi:hypothetical protein